MDYRADLYAVGATLYELATGEPPFGRDGDPPALIHDYLARVPVAPAEVNPQIPALLSAIIMRLLGKEPEQRYRSGEGLAHDLARLRDGYGGGAMADFVLGERDFPMRLAPPARLVGRDVALAELRALFAAAVTGNCGVALVTGAPGVGKTALIERLRPSVAAAGGRCVTGKFDQYRRDLGADAVLRAFCALGAQLLAEPDEELARLRARLLAALGADAALAAAAMPPFATEVLRLPAIEAAPLAEALGAWTGGNPFDTLELLNALRREGALVPDGHRWCWDPETLRRFVGKGDIACSDLAAVADRSISPSQVSGAVNRVTLPSGSAKQSSPRNEAALRSEPQQVRTICRSDFGASRSRGQGVEYRLGCLVNGR